jgi:hypothetical protein
MDSGAATETETRVDADEENSHQHELKVTQDVRKEDLLNAAHSKEHKANVRGLLSEIGGHLLKHVVVYSVECAVEVGVPVLVHDPVDHGHFGIAQIVLASDVALLDIFWFSCLKNVVNKNVVETFVALFISFACSDLLQKLLVRLVASQVVCVIVHLVDEINGSLCRETLRQKRLN